MTKPPRRSRSLSTASYFFAATARILDLAFFAAPIAELPAMKVVRLAWTPTSQGVMAVSLLTTVMAEIGRPSSSQTSCESTVSEPWPISEAPVISVTLAKSSILRMVPQPSEG